MIIKSFDVMENEVKEVEEKVLFEDYENGWESKLDEIFTNSIDKIDFKREDVDRSVYVILEDGEMLRLKDGRWFVVCYSILGCKVWEEDEEFVLEFDKMFE